MGRAKMDETLQIVTADSDHAASLARLHERGFARSWDVSSFKAFLSDRNFTALLALPAQDLEPVGFMLARATGAEAEILTIMVAPERQGEGIGRRLFGTLIAVFRARGAARMVLEVGVQNIRARRLYEGLGFSMVGRRRAYYRKINTRHREDALIMALPLGVDVAGPVDARAESAYKNTG